MRASRLQLQFQPDPLRNFATNYGPTVASILGRRSIHRISNHTHSPQYHLIMKLVTVVGARPQFIKAAVLSRELNSSGVKEVMVHTGQHYDPMMSDIFFRELQIPKPDYQLDLGGNSHGRMTGRMLERIEEILQKENPTGVVVYGDTNSTLAGALAAAKLQIPVFHVEAGLRSYNRRMPEEINRVMTDHLSAMLFCSSESGALNLRNEGISQGVHVVGDIMRPALEHALSAVDSVSDKVRTIVETLGDYALFTCHRAESTDSRENLRAIIDSLIESRRKILWPAHPRISLKMEEFGLADLVSRCKNIHSIQPFGYFDMIFAASRASLIITDSGGLQKEAYWLEKPCVTLREETEWTETVESGWNKLTGYDRNKILSAIRTPPLPLIHDSDIYGSSSAANLIVKLIMEFKHSK
jgi:UDP-GlcNAc3NAcA epimerase